MAKITLGKLSGDNTIRGMRELISKSLPIKTAFKVKTLTNKLNEELKKYNELRKEIMESYCKKGEDGKPVPDERGNYQFEPTALEDLGKKMKELNELEIDFEPIKVDELGNIEVTPEQLLNLGDLLDA